MGVSTIILSYYQPSSKLQLQIDKAGYMVLLSDNYQVDLTTNVVACLKKNLNASRPSEHPPVRGGEMSKRLVGGIIGCEDKTSL